jgi:hypothetical protein
MTIILMMNTMDQFRFQGATRARSTGLLETSEVVAGVTEGLKLSDKAVCNYQGEDANIALIGACLYSAA